MIGYAYLDADRRLYRKTTEYLQEDPGFWNRNREFIIEVWKFDTDDKRTLIHMLKRLSLYRVTPHVVKAFLAELGLTVEELREADGQDASQIQPK